MSDSVAFGENPDVQYAYLSQILARVVKEMLQKVIESSEGAVIEITQKIQGMSNLSEGQKSALSGALEKYYHTPDDGLKDTLNEKASLMLEAAQNGDLETVEKIAADPSYNHARKATKELHDSLQGIIHCDKAMNEYIMPVILALQFQDKVRQQLESISKSFEDYLAFAEPALKTNAPKEPALDLWKKIAQNFTLLEDRTLILKTALGETYEPDEEDLRDTGTTGSDNFFF